MISIGIDVDATNAFAGLDLAKTHVRNSLFQALVMSTALARKTVIDNIKFGMKSGLGWPAFAPSTIRRKIKMGRSLVGLVDKGQMMDSIQESVDKNSLEGIVYPGVDYLKFHEKGTRRLKERPIMGPVKEQISSKIMDIFRSEIAKGLAST